MQALFLALRFAPSMLQSAAARKDRLLNAEDADDFAFQAYLGDGQPGFAGWMTLSLAIDACISFIHTYLHENDTQHR
ncbi:MAG: hypothetical protein M1608_14910 [Candidatus Omnitrophica bacterium]|nr:hypothetical protein [Candidatus Omnitrophota bacterium]